MNWQSDWLKAANNTKIMGLILREHTQATKETALTVNGNSNSLWMRASAKGTEANVEAPRNTWSYTCVQ